MLIACLWSRWVGPGGQELPSFAAITDDPSAEVLAVGHPLHHPGQGQARVAQPGPAWLAAPYAILDDPEWPYYDQGKIA